jgi:Rrf2 family protein
MLEISQAIEYGIRGIIHMAQIGPDRPVLVKEIAKAENISPTFLHKIFQRLVQSRILNSRRGVGYTFAVHPSSITLLDLIEAIEGPISLRRCLLDKDYCERVEHCALAGFWTELQEELISKLGSTTVQDLASLRR